MDEWTNLIRSGLRDRVVVVVGGSGVLCGALAQALGQQGALVVVVGHSNLAKAEQVAEQIAAQGGQAIALQANALSKDSLFQLAHHTLDAFGRVDILINGAGGAKREATTSETLSFFDLPEDAGRPSLNRDSPVGLLSIPRRADVGRDGEVGGTLVTSHASPCHPHAVRRHLMRGALGIGARQ